MSDVDDVPSSASEVDSPKPVRLNGLNSARQHPTYAAMIRRAIDELNDKKGASKPAILKYVSQHYNLGEQIMKINKHLCAALVSGVANQTILQPVGSGANGRFRNPPKTTKTAVKKNKDPAMKSAPIKRISTGVKKQTRKPKVDLSGLTEIQKKARAKALRKESQKAKARAAAEAEEQKKAAAEAEEQKKAAAKKAQAPKKAATPKKAVKKVAAAPVVKKVAAKKVSAAETAAKKSPVAKKAAVKKAPVAKKAPVVAEKPVAAPKKVIAKKPAATKRAAKKV